MPKHLTQEEKIKLCKSWKQSGLKQVEFCKHKGINKKSFSRWLNQLKANNIQEIGQSKTKAIKFLPIDSNCINNNHNTKTNDALEIKLLNGVIIKINLDQKTINTLLQDILKWK